MFVLSPPPPSSVLLCPVSTWPIACVLSPLLPSPPLGESVRPVLPLLPASGVHVLPVPHSQCLLLEIACPSGSLSLPGERPTPCVSSAAQHPLPPAVHTPGWHSVFRVFFSLVLVMPHVGKLGGYSSHPVDRAAAQADPGTAAWMGGSWHPGSWMDRRAVLQACCVWDWGVWPGVLPSPLGLEGGAA